MAETADVKAMDGDLGARLESHFLFLLKPLIEGKVIPFLGAGVNMCGRPGKTAWGKGTYLPSGWELTEHLAQSFSYPAEEPKELSRVSQYVAVKTGSGPLYEELRGLFDADYPTTILHRFLAGLPRAVREKGYPPRYPLIVTTNYDDVLERAFHQTAVSRTSAIHHATRR
jgi:hypothetical protein